MANRYRGEIAATLDGRELTLCLTLGALAELETAFGVDTLSQLLARIGTGALSSSHISAIIGAGLRGAGHDYSNAQIAAMAAPGGPRQMANIAAGLLEATFGTGLGGGDAEPPPNPPRPQDR
jgi:Phage tail tube protein, GTA-gp10